MSLFSRIGRRAFLAGQAGAAVLAAAPTAFAATPKADKSGTTPVRWDTLTAEELSSFTGQRFSVQMDDGENMALRLVSVEPTISGDARPAVLPRREGLIAIFESPDMEPLVAAGHRNCKIRHAMLGSADLFLGPVPKKSGGHVIELVLN